MSSNNLIIDKLIKILSESKSISGWKIEEDTIKSDELYFVYKDLDMNRAKSIKNITVTVYKDFLKEDKKCKGSASIIIHPTMEYEEIEKLIEEAAFAAGFVANEYYELPKPSDSTSKKLSKGTTQDYAKLLSVAKALYKNDNSNDGRINSSEFFISTVSKRIINSEGIDLCCETSKGDMEFISSWKGKEEDVELYKNIKFREPDEELFMKSAEDMLNMCKERAAAVATPALKDIPVIITGDPVEELFKHYYFTTGASAVYDKLSTYSIGDKIQGENVLGDLLTIELDPFMEGSPDYEFFDEDGVELSKVTIIENGVFKNSWGDNRHSYYLGSKPTGRIKNVVVACGAKTIAELKNEPHLEVKAFSDFRMDIVTGDFAGEIRLAWYFDGKDAKAVTGGSISGNIKNVHNNIYLSKEVQKGGNFTGPKSVKLYGATIAGRE